MDDVRLLRTIIIGSLDPQFLIDKKLGFNIPRIMIKEGMERIPISSFIDVVKLCLKKSNYSVFEWLSG